MSSSHIFKIFLPIIPCLFFGGKLNAEKKKLFEEFFCYLKQVLYEVKKNVKLS